MYHVNALPKKFLQELSVFYVAVTRARKKVCFFRSQLNHNNKFKPASCFLFLAGIEVEEQVIGVKEKT